MWTDENSPELKDLGGSKTGAEPPDQADLSL